MEGLFNRIGSNKKNQLIWEQAWSIYDDIVKLTYGNTMSREIENKSKEILAEMIAKFEFESKSNIFGHIASGLTSGTAESEIFQKSYNESCISIQKKAINKSY